VPAAYTSARPATPATSGSSGARTATCSATGSGPAAPAPTARRPSPSTNCYRPDILTLVRNNVVSTQAGQLQVLADKASAMLRQGPSGWWRLLKNIARIGSGRGRLHPCTPAWWTQALQTAGYNAVRYEHVSSEAGIVVGTRPG